MLSRGRNGRRIVGPMGQEVMQSSGGRGDEERSGWRTESKREREREWMESASMNGGGMVVGSGGF